MMYTHVYICLTLVPITINCMPHAACRMHLIVVFCVWLSWSWYWSHGTHMCDASMHTLTKSGTIISPTIINSFSHTHTPCLLICIFLFFIKWILFIRVVVLQQRATREQTSEIWLLTYTPQMWRQRICPVTICWPGWTIACNRNSPKLRNFARVSLTFRSV